MPSCGCSWYALSSLPCVPIMLQVRSCLFQLKETHMCASCCVRSSIVVIPDATVSGDQNHLPPAHASSWLCTPAWLHTGHFTGPYNHTSLLHKCALPKQALRGCLHGVTKSSERILSRQKGVVWEAGHAGVSLWHGTVMQGM